MRHSSLHFFFLTDDPNCDGNVHHNKKLDDLIRLAEMCVDQLQQNEEHYAEVSWLIKGANEVWYFIFLLFLFSYSNYSVEKNFRIQYT